MKHVRLSLIFAALGAVAFAPGARADCVDGVREPTKAELDFAARAQAALIAGLPALPPPIVRRGPPKNINERVGMSFCRGAAIGSFDVSIADGYRYEFTPAEASDRSQRRRELLRQVEQIEQLPPEKEAQRKALSDQARAAYDAMPRRSRKDPPFTPEQQALVDKQNAEGRRLEDAARRVESDHRASVKAQTDPLSAQANRLQQGPQEFTVHLAMNVERFPDTGATVLATFGTPSAKLSAGLVAHNVVLSVGGPDGPARRALADAVDRKYLQGLIGKLPPDVAASQARMTAVAAAPPPPAVQPSVGATGAASPGAAPAAAGAAAATASAATAAARPATQPASPPASPSAPREEQKKAEPTTTTQDAANAVNKLRGLLGR